jgi:hypothetical protein
MAEGQGARLIPNQKGGQNLVDEQNFKYRKQREKKDKTTVMYQCVKKFVQKCPAVVEYMKVEQVIIRRLHEHNHGPDLLRSAAR